MPTGHRSLSGEGDASGPVPFDQEDDDDRGSEAGSGYGIPGAQLGPYGETLRNALAACNFVSDRRMIGIV